MPFESPAEDFDNDNAEKIEIEEAALTKGDEADESDDEEIASDDKGKEKGNEHSLEVRRAIEDHLERTRLQKELDYLFDEHFTDEDKD